MVISREEAFSVLGDGRRPQIYRTVGEAGGPLAFAELWVGVEYDETGNYDYACFRCFRDSIVSIESARSLKPTTVRGIRQFRFTRFRYRLAVASAVDSA